MSAFIVCKTHVDYILSAALKYGVVPECQLSLLGRILWGENHRSFAYRYQGRHRQDMHDWDEYDFEAVAAELVTAGWALAAVHCLAYQACECPDWEETFTCRFLQGLRKKLEHEAGGPDAWKTDDRPWEVSAEVLSDRALVGLREVAARGRFRPQRPT